MTAPFIITDGERRWRWNEIGFISQAQPCRRSSWRCAFPPDVKRGFPELLVDAAWDEMTLDGEDVLNSGLDGKKALGGSRRFEETLLAGHLLILL